MPVYSMTGYAVSTCEAPAPSNAASVTVELRSVNGRFLDLSLKLPDELRGLEPALREMVAAAVRPEVIKAVVSRGGRPDLAGAALPLVKAPTLLIVGGALGGGALGYLLADGLRARRSDAYASAAGLTLGITNAALLLRPLGRADTSEEVLPILLAGSVVGAGAGLAVGHGLALTRGQVMFAADLGLLGVGTVALTSGLFDQDDEADDSELIALQVGLDVGVAAGLVLAPQVDWSYRRARWVGAASLAGFFAGSLIAVGATDKGQDPDPDVVGASVLTGMWAGFGLGVLLTRGWDAEPFYRFASGRLTYACAYDNPRDTAVSEGASALDNEMCMAIAYYVPATAPTFCFNDTVVR